MSDTRSAWEAVAEGPAFWEALGRAIKVERTARGWERKDLAERSGLSYPYLSEIETGRKRPGYKALVVIAAALGIPLSDLLRAAETWTGALPEEEAFEPASGHRPGAGRARDRHRWDTAFRVPRVAMPADREEDPLERTSPRAERAAVLHRLHALAERLDHEDLRALVAVAERLSGTRD